MHPYLPTTKEDLKLMLEAIGVYSIDDLFKVIPEDVRLDRELNLDKAKSEIEVRRQIEALGKKNKSIDDLTCFLGAGSYDHYVPSTIKAIVGRSEFYTAYTPYQPEIAQGTLQSVWEYQSMMCLLTGMDVSNVSMYDGPTAAAEAAILATVSQRRKTVLVSDAMNPETKEVLETYGTFRDINIKFIPSKDGVTDFSNLDTILDKDVAAVIVANPNFNGCIEDLYKVVEKIHANKSLLIMQVDPISLALIKTPGEIGADICVGEGQALGQTMNYGGPVLGFLCATDKLVRKMPGRIIGKSKDIEGNDAYVLTLQAREQHIRREKATSNICSDQTLNSVAAAVYMATMGPDGMYQVAYQSMQKSHYLANELEKTGKFKLKYSAPFFKEFVMETDLDIDKLNAKLMEKGIMGPMNLDAFGQKNLCLFCVTENRSKEEMDKLVKELEVM